MFSKFASVVAAVTVASLSTLAVAATELTTNGGFETGDFTGWTQFPTAVDQQTVVTTNPSSGTYAGRINNVVRPSGSVLKQANIGIGQVSPGQEITIQFDYRGTAADGGVVFAELFSELSGGGVSKSEILGGGPLFPNADPEVWTTALFTTTAGPDVSGGITLQLAATTGGASTSTADIYFDNASVSIVPEPVSMSALGLAGLGLLRRRR